MLFGIVPPDIVGKCDESVNYLVTDTGTITFQHFEFLVGWQVLDLHFIGEPVYKLPAHHFSFVNAPPLALDRVDGCNKPAVRMAPDHLLVQAF